jgi:hypothetical protein
MLPILSSTNWPEFGALRVAGYLANSLPIRQLLQRQGA